MSQVVIVTGSSGGGKSSVLRMLEDIDFFCIDNVPLELFESCTQLIGHSSKVGSQIALGIDVRGVVDIQQLVVLIVHLKQRQQSVVLLYVTASEETLIKRFQETRRKHPLTQKKSITDAIAYEQTLLSPLRDVADKVIETDSMTIHQLRLLVRSFFVPDVERKLMVTFMSFGFKYGIPTESNFIYDVRSLPNPYFVPELRPFSGCDTQVHDYLFAQPFVQEYWQKLDDFVRFAIEAAYKEGRSFITLAIGCTGGRHRSVAFVERLGGQIYPQATCLTKHRDIVHEDHTLKVLEHDKRN